ncbi:MAG TPA: AAA family ATPase [Mycobacteriales bacterium]|nr:AAA family ATPase [Mycobacteriales bacterium]
MADDVAPSDPVFAAFCQAGLWPGLGRTLAAALSEAGIRRPDDVTADRLGELPGVGPVRAERLYSSWIGAGTAYQVTAMMVPVGLPARWAARAIDLLGEDAARLLADDPWRLLELPEAKVGEADRFAIAVAPGVRRSDPRRGRALVAHALVRAARDGHTMLPAGVVASALDAEGVPDPAAAIEAACQSGAVIPAADGVDGADTDAAPPGTVLALDRYAMAEDGVAEAVTRLAATAKPIGQPGDVDEAAEDLDEAQRGAVTNALGHGVSVLTGGPGTGKSRTVATLVRICARHGARIALAAPTGRAAKRLEELTGAPASTIHRLLGAHGRGEADRRGRPGYGTVVFSRGESWPLDCDVVVVDEASMLDAELAAALVEACDEGTHLLFVGDPAQLPSIGAGRVLADLVESGTVPVTELTTLYRQAEGGAIARLATAVRGGELPQVDSPDREVVVVSAAGSAQASHRVVQLVTDSIPRALGIESADVQVVTPVHRGPAGTAELNRALKARLNPGRGTVAGFDPGDRVVATANHLDCEPAGFANGEVGVVTAAGHGQVTVEFASGPAKVSGKALSDLLHGWAITVHRAQGSEWPAVVVVLPPEAGGMLSRPLVYTALTRARRHLSIVHASGPVLARAVRDVGARPRRTRLRELLRDAAG